METGIKNRSDKFHDVSLLGQARTAVCAPEATHSGASQEKKKTY